MFTQWVRLLESGRYISVKLFDDLVNYYLKAMPTACGIHGRCAVQFVVEGDGSAFPCDFYVLDRFRLGSLADSTPAELYPFGEDFIRYGKGYVAGAPCLGCHYLQSCGGGCKRMKDSMYISNGVCWYAKLLDEILAPLISVGKKLS